MSRTRTSFLAALLALPLSAPEGRPAAPAAPVPHRDRYGDPLPAHALARLGSVRFRHPDVKAVAFAPGGELLASGGGDGCVRLWHPGSGKELARLAHPAEVTALAFSRDGKLLASACGDLKVSLWDPATGRQVRVMDGSAEEVRRLAFSPDGKVVRGLSWGPSRGLGTLYTWDTATGRRAEDSKGLSGKGLPADLAPDGTVAVTTSFGVEVWDTAARKAGKPRRGPGVRAEEEAALAFDPHGKVLAALQGEDTVHLWDVARGAARRTFDLAQPVSWRRGLALSADGKFLAALSDADAGVIHDTATGHLHTSFRLVGPAVAMTFSPDSKTLAVAQESGIVRQIDVATGLDRTPAPGFPSPYARAFMPDGRSLVLATGKAIRIVDALTGRSRRTLVVHRGEVFGPVVTPDGKTLVSAGTEATIRFWDLVTGKERHHIDGDYGFADCLALSPDGKTLASGGWPGVVRLWDMGRGTERARFRAHQGPVCSLTFSPDGKTLYTAGRNGEAIRAWDVPTRKEVRNWAAHRNYTALALSPDGKLLASSGPDGKPAIRLWGPATGKERTPARFASAPATSAVTFAPSGKLLASGSEDGTVLLWDLKGNLVRRLRGHQDEAYRLAFNRDGSLLASTSSDGTVLVWDMTGRAARPPAPRPNAERLEALWRDLGADPVRWLEAHGELVRAGAPAVRFLGKRLPAALRGPDLKRVGRLVRDLDSDEYEVRTRAFAELDKMGQSARPALKKALEGEPSPEVRRRVERLLKKLRRELSPDEVRPLRAVWVLEEVGTPAARRVLKKLAGGPPSSLSREAKSAQRRLERKP
jgi:WD40 repeat protein